MHPPVFFFFLGGGSGWVCSKSIDINIEAVGLPLSGINVFETGITLSGCPKVTVAAHAMLTQLCTEIGSSASK
jgi:hypothetical protein